MTFPELYRVRKSARKESPEEQCYAFNAKVPVGSPVWVTLDDGARTRSKTTCEAWVMGGHTAVVLLEGISGCYLLDRVAPRDEH